MNMSLDFIGNFNRELDKAMGNSAEFAKSVNQASESFNKMSTGAALAAAKVSQGVAAMASNAISGASLMAKNVSSGASEMSKKITTGISGMVESVKKITPIANEAISAFTDKAKSAREINKALEDTIKSTAGAAGFTSQQIIDMAEGFEKTSTFGVGTIKTGQNVLLTFTNIGHEVFPQATQAMLDMSQKMGSSLPDTALKLGKALNDPISGMETLKEVGISLSDQQKQQIEGFVKNGQAIEAQKMIVAELNKVYGGEASAATQTFQGRMKQLGNVIESVKVRIGGNLLPYVEKATEAFGFVKGYVDQATQAFGFVKETINNAASAFKTFKEVASTLKGPLGLIVLAFAVLAGAYATNFCGFKTWADGMAEKVKICFNAISAAFKDLMAFGKLSEGSIKGLSDAFGSQMASRIVNVVSVAVSLGKVLKELFYTGKLSENGMKELSNVFGSQVASKIISVVSAVASLGRVFKEFAFTGKVSEESAKQLANAFGSGMSAKIILSLNGIKGAFSIFKSVITGDFKSAEECIKQFSSNGNTRMADFLSKFKAITAAVKAVVQGLIGLITGNFAGFKNTLVNGFGMSGSSAEKFAHLLTGVRNTVISIVQGMGNVVVAVFKFIVNHGTLIKATLSGVVGGFVALKTVSTTITVINGVKNAFLGIKAAIATVRVTIISFKTAITVVRTALVSLKTTITGIKLAFTSIRTAITAIKTAFMAFRSVLMMVRVAFTLLKIAFVSNPFGILVFAIGAVIGVLIYLWTTNENFRNKVKMVWAAIVVIFKSGIENIKNAINYIKELPQRFSTWGKDMIEGLVQGITNGIGKVTDAVKGVANKIKSYLHFSRPDVGPLAEYESWMPDFMNGLAGGISKNKHIVLKATQDVALGISGKMNIRENGTKQIRSQGSTVSSTQSDSSRNITIHIPKLADTLTVREDADIDKIAYSLAKKLESMSFAM